MPGIKDVITKGGVLPALMSDKKTRGFAMGVIPGIVGMQEYERAEKKRQQEEAAAAAQQEAAASGMKKGGMVKKTKPKATKSRGDGIAQRGKTKGRMV